MKNEELYLQIKFYDNDFYQEGELLGKYIQSLIKYYDLDIINLANSYDDYDYTKTTEELRNIFLKMHKINYYNEMLSEDNKEKEEIEEYFKRIKEYFNKNFLIKFISQSEVTNTNASSLYVQLTGENKGSYFIY